MLYKNIHSLCAEIVKTSRHKIDYFNFKNKKHCDSFLIILENVGLIRKFEKYNNDNYFKIFLKYNYKTLPVILNIKYYKKNHKNFFINKINLLILLNKNPLSIFLLSTKIGLIDHKYALKKNIYGSLFLKIN